ncbi:hypothetical protein [Paenibacillus popilliae]|uniref:Predicted membrane protein n=1 Tax=Paenibacillus popilliae ATCC 14706 TaxID=1212764 RepID=M9LRD1_PAEPP|nr:hypothetical protein [Paenibacillus popilliae]GAC43886.1 predicted membrane protein [Paenibacillus popilliae ATCC 14706]
MAFENGDLAIDYIGETIDNYKRDRTIFSQVYSLIPVFLNRPDWPHCYDELDRTIEMILGNSLTGLVFEFTSRYLHSEEIVWPDDLPDSFFRDLSTFHTVTKDLVYQFWAGRTTPLKLYSIAKSSDHPYGKTLIRFIRMDGVNLDLEVDENDINTIIRLLKGIINNDENE